MHMKKIMRHYETCRHDETEEYCWHDETDAHEMWKIWKW